MQSLFAVKTREKRTEIHFIVGPTPSRSLPGFALERAEIASDRPHRLAKLAVRNQKK
jgi:hypothetical protein